MSLRVDKPVYQAGGSMPIDGVVLPPFITRHIIDFVTGLFTQSETPTASLRTRVTPNQQSTGGIQITGPVENLPDQMVAHFVSQGLFKKEEAYHGFELPGDIQLVFSRLPNYPPPSLSVENKPFVRYSDVRPFERNRCELSSGAYIDASRDPAGFIRTSGPKANTVQRFWEMVWESKASTIVMATQCVEGSKEKCSHYWPDGMVPLTYGDLQVFFRSSAEAYRRRVYHFQLSKNGQRKHRVTQLQLLNWGDHGVISTEELHQAIIHAERLHGNGKGPMVVHCSAGVGRTGTFCAAYALYMAWKRDLAVSSIPDLVAEGRKQRVFSVQTASQLRLLYDYANFLAGKARGEVT